MFCVSAALCCPTSTAAAFSRGAGPTSATACTKQCTLLGMRWAKMAVVGVSRLLALRYSQQVPVRCDEVLQDDLLLLPEHVHLRNSPRLLHATAARHRVPMGSRLVQDTPLGSSRCQPIRRACAVAAHARRKKRDASVNVHVDVHAYMYDRCSRTCTSNKMRCDVPT